MLFIYPNMQYYSEALSKFIPGTKLLVIFRIFWIRGVFWVGLGYYVRTIRFYLSYTSTEVLTFLSLIHSRGGYIIF